jgi:SpoVK/Ycf46/Vps4 family AAA+-type ATPase
MIGMKSIKEMIIDLIIFKLQNIKDNNEELWHLVIQGPPGCGKTEVSKIIGKIYYSLGIVKKDLFRLVKRSDLIGKYLGHTARLTQDVFDEARGGIIFIDEAYSLGNPDGRDSFSKECIDTINQNLTENKNTVVFIAGYKEQLDESFFSYNPGLNRRFKIRFNVDKYNFDELRQIFIKKIYLNNWSVFDNNEDKEIPLDFFKKNINYFKYSGGDMENLWHFCKIAHARRIFGKSNDIVKKITFQDLENAFKNYSNNDEFKNRVEFNNIDKYIRDTMYS